MKKALEKIKNILKNADSYGLIICAVSMIAGIIYLSVTMSAKVAGDDCMSLPTEYYTVTHTAPLQMIKNYYADILSYFKLEYARFFPFFFPASYIRSWFKAGVGIYRLYIIAYTYLDILVLSYFIARVLKNKNIGRAVFCIMPLLIGIWSQIDTNAMYSYEALVQATLFPMLLSGLCMLRWSDTGKKRWIALAAVLSFYSCTTYELGFILIIPVWGLLWIYENEFKKSLIRVLPAVGGEVVALLINILCRYVHRMESTQGVAYGVQFSFDFKAMCRTFIYQVKAGIPLLAMRTNHVTFGQVVLSDVLLSVILVLAVVAIVKKLTASTAKNNILLFLVGLSLLIGPAGLVSLSVKFQEEVWVNENYGYLPAVIQVFGLGIMLMAVLAVVMKWLENKKMFIIKEMVLVFMILCLVPMGIYQRSATRERNREGDVEYSWYVDSISNGLLDRGQDTADYISYQNVWGDSDAAQSIFVARYTERGLDITCSENWKGRDVSPDGLYMYGLYMNEEQMIPVAWIGDAMDSSAQLMKNVALYIPEGYAEQISVLQYKQKGANGAINQLSVNPQTLKMKSDGTGVYFYLEGENIIPDYFKAW